ncbi:DUF3397 domain-containing protein [Aquibacillus albus]|uniref:DUF3397 family protein n=1 Tax=Aquibacillus albus TaxID=1168171 RepID=A0ABS2N0T8_9BACI|nr:hypothetical protein [Aquibacillus albus]
MITVFSNVTACLITFPILFTILLYIGVLKAFRNKWKSVYITVNYTTILYIFSVGILLYVLFERNFIGYIFIFLLVLLSTIILIQWKTKEEIIFIYAWKIFWRLTFLLFFFLHISLILLGLGMTIARI